MADSKKYDGSQWVHSLRKLTTATEAVENPLYSDGTAITAYNIKGNTIQDGTPTPSNPVEVQGVGNKTANLYFKKIDSCAIAENGELQNSSNDNMWIAQITQGTSYTISALAYAGFFYNEPVKGSISYNNTRELIPSSNLTFTAPITGYVAVRYNKSNETPMINEGTTGLPYEPYGYKIPISSGGVTIPIYLSQPLMLYGEDKDALVSSGLVTRTIYKYVLTGQENITLASGNAPFIVPLPANITSFTTQQTKWLCTHYPSITPAATWANYDYLLSANTNVRTSLRFRDIDYSTVDDFKAFLAQEYTNGTPVTIYYVLETPTTETVTAPPIPTTEGANTITVDTTVQPSEFTATWTGWHDSSVKEKSRNLFDGNNTTLYDAYISSNNLWASAANNKSIRVPVNGNTTYTLSTTLSSAASVYKISESDIDDVQPSSSGTVLTNVITNSSLSSGFNEITFTTQSATKWLIIQVNGANINNYIDNLMLNTGETALPYEPYWK